MREVTVVKEVFEEGNNSRSEHETRIAEPERMVGGINIELESVKNLVAPEFTPGANERSPTYFPKKSIRRG